MPGETSLYPDICLLTKPPKGFCFLKVPNVVQKSRLCYWKTIKTGVSCGGFCVNYSGEALQGTGGLAQRRSDRKTAFGDYNAENIYKGSFIVLHSQLVYCFSAQMSL